MKKVLLVIFALVLVGFIIVFIKYVNLFTPGNSVIKKYSYSGDIKEFISDVKKFSLSDSNVVFVMTDTTGTPQTGYDYYMNIELKSNEHDYLYTVQCGGKIDVKTNGTAVDLIMAYDKSNNIGGYNKEAKGVRSLVKYFDDFFITQMRNSQNSNIIPL